MSDLLGAVLPTENTAPVDPSLWVYLLTANASLVVVLLS